MAKTGFWLRGARGKFAGAVLAKGADGQTIQRELVKPKNPRTNGQMAQRMIFATVASAYSMMKAICDHSFEGVQYGAKTQQAFFKETLALMRTRAAADDGNFLIPNVSALMPNPYVISRGSLTSPKNIAFSIGDDSIKISGMSNPTIDNVVIVTAKSFCDALGINKGDQITLVAIVKDADQPVLGEYAGREYRRNRFVYARITVKADADDNAVVWSGTGNWGSAVIVEGFDDYLFNIGSATASEMNIEYPWDMLAFGCIRSAKEDNVWLRSNESLKLSDEGLEQVYNFSDMLPAWTSTGTELIFDSTRYLNNAEAENVVTTPGLTKVAARCTNAGKTIIERCAALSKGPYEGTPIVDSGNTKHPYDLKNNGHLVLMSDNVLLDGYITKEFAEKQLGTEIIVDQNP